MDTTAATVRGEPHLSHLRRLGSDEPTEDLSPLVAQTIGREPGDHVECTRIHGSRYRCNWWTAQATGAYDNPDMKGGQLATTHRIRQSRFLDVTRTSEGLQIAIVEDQPPATGVKP